MELERYYENLYQSSIQKILAGVCEPDELIDSPADQRFGITLLLRPDAAVKASIEEVLSEIRRIEPNQYFYPTSDMHVTLMSIISCYDGFQLAQIQQEDYLGLIRKSIAGLRPFRLDFRGLTASPSALMVQGFPLDDTLGELRDRLRNNFKETDLEQSLDKRYMLQTAHSTIFRMKQRLNNPARFLKLLESYRKHDFGTFTVNSLELVYNDWYQRQEKVVVLGQFELK